MELDHKQELNHLLEFINQCPFGLIKTDQKGEILLLNAVGSQVLIPIALDIGLALDNILDLLGHFDKTLREKIESYQESFGFICKNARVKVKFQALEREQYLSFSVIRISPDIYQYAFVEVTETVLAEKRLNEITEATALQSGKLEMASGVLHDIGNAVTAFGGEVAKFAGDLDWRELNDLQKLSKLFEQKSVNLDAAMGPGKGQALLKFVQALRDSLQVRQKEYSNMAGKLSETTSHIQDILNIQRHYVKGKTKGERAPIQLRNIVEDALAMQERMLEKRGIKLERDFPLNLPSIKGDKTKLIQVLVNIIKNAGEAFDEQLDNEQKQIRLWIQKSSHDKSMIELCIQDNAMGFEPGSGESFFQRGITSKRTGSGFGLHNCRKIIETHQGQITLESKGKGLGALVCIKLPFVVEEILTL